MLITRRTCALHAPQVNASCAKRSPTCTSLPKKQRIRCRRSTTSRAKCATTNTQQHTVGSNRVELLTACFRASKDASSKPAGQTKQHLGPRAKTHFGEADDLEKGWMQQLEQRHHQSLDRLRYWLLLEEDLHLHERQPYLNARKGSVEKK